MHLEILYEDNHVIAVYKPAGVLVQANERGVENLLDEVKKYLKEKYKKPGNVFAGLVHRLDRPVSGIVVFAKTSKGASRLSEQFREREVSKIYTAVVEGEINKEGRLIHFIKKDEEKIVAMIRNDESAGYQRSELEYLRTKSNKKYSMIKINLLTGRFNQIRAQLSHIGHPIVGDKKYGAGTIHDTRYTIHDSIALCATEIEFKTATTDESIKLNIGYPENWDKFFD